MNRVAAVKPKIRRDDTVMVIVGKERGKTGKVLKVLSREQRLIIEHLNMVKRHLKPQGQRGGGGIMEKEAPISLSNVMIMCEQCNAPVRIGVRKNKERASVRFCRRCGEDIDR